jgi:hypothetical protein
MTTIENDNGWGYLYGALVEYKNDVYVVDRETSSWPGRKKPGVFHVVSRKDRAGEWVTEDMIKRI